MADEVVTMAYHGQVPWHSKGTKIEHHMSPAEAAAAAGMNFTIERTPITAQGVELEGYAAYYRSDMGVEHGLLTVAGAGYEPFQPSDFVQYFNGIVKNCLFVDRNEKGEAQIIETAGVLRHPGKVLWMLAKIPGEIIMPNHRDDKVNKFLLLTTANDGSGATRLKFCCERVVCANTLTAALGEEEVTVSVRHTKNACYRLEEAKEAIGIMEKSYEETARAWEAMARKQLTQALLKQYVEECLPARRKIDENGAEVLEVTHRIAEARQRVYELHERDPYARGTLWGAFGAVTEYFDHERPRRKTTDRGFDVLFGEAAKRQRRALNVALEMLS